MEAWGQMAWQGMLGQALLDGDRTCPLMHNNIKGAHSIR